MDLQDYIDDARKEERANTLREAARADAAEMRASTAEQRASTAEQELARYKKLYGEIGEK